MVLNYIWLAFFLIAFVIAALKAIVEGDMSLFPSLVEAMFDNAKKGFEISLGLTGAMALWMGLLNIGEQSGLIGVVARWVTPFFAKLFPEVPAGHPVMGAMLMNFSANMLGLDNAATPLGLKAMQGLQTLNPEKETASNAQIMFLVINTAGLTLIPVSVMALRLQAGASNPADVFLPSLIGTSISAISGIIIVSLWQRVNLLNWVVLGVLGVFCAFLAGLVTLLAGMPEKQLSKVSAGASSLILLVIVVGILTYGMRKGLNVYDHFIDGAKQAFETAVKIIPYILAMLVAIGVFRASGALDYVLQGFAFVASGLGLDTGFVNALPTGLMKPFSGGGARGLMVEAMKTYGPDSFTGRLVCVLQGSTETTFYVLAVYFGSVGIKRTRYAATAGLLVDLIGIIAAIYLGYLFFGHLAGPAGSAPIPTSLPH
jgi:spore maturation protein SpmA